MYAGDSFFSLTMIGRTGLILVSVVLAAVTVAAFLKCARKLPAAARLLLALVFFWAFVWLSPQLYYLYYMILIDGLPLQNIVQKPPGLSEIVKLLSFGGKASLAHHSQGVLGWTLILLSFFRPSANLRNRFLTFMSK